MSKIKKVNLEEQRKVLATLPDSELLKHAKFLSELAKVATDKQEAENYILTAKLAHRMWINSVD